MFLIQEGVVQISLKLGYSQNSDRPDFIIERLRRGAIINHRAFLPFQNDDSDTEFYCKTTVSAFILRKSVIQSLESKQTKNHKQLRDKIATIKNDLEGKEQIALDYIIHNNHKEETVYKKTLE